VKKRSGRPGDPVPRRMTPETIARWISDRDYRRIGPFDNCRPIVERLVAEGRARWLDAHRTRVAACLDGVTIPPRGLKVLLVGQVDPSMNGPALLKRVPR
jgi:hypothetical protein